MSMKVLVLGGNGFIGSHVVDQLLLEGYQVRIFDRSPEHHREPLAQVDYIFGTFDDQLQVAKAMQGVDAICHLISTTVPSTSNLDPIADVQSNLVNTLSLLESMRKNGVRRLLYLSSGGTVYGNPKYSPIDEEHPLNPICSYGVVKVAIEKYLMMYQYLYDLDVIIFRPSNPYGPRQSYVGVQGLISVLLNKALTGDTFQMWGDGSIVRDYLHVTDLAKLCVHGLSSDHCGVYNAGSGQGYSVHDILAIVHDLTHQKIHVHANVGRDFDVKKVVLNINAAVSIFHWQPEITLTQGIQTHLSWLQQQ
ncbi:MAG: NAD-dependent epimerase/dehydratase family protein [Mariprofundaceae bacterium]|nr:NAD-dependent epimerase/dehydratase family protein [Mariprofundaceae bacterium]